MRDKFILSFLLMIEVSYLQANEQIVQEKPVQVSTFQKIRTKVTEYIKNALPQTKKDWALAIISEGIAEGILFYAGFKRLQSVYRNNPQDMIDASKGFLGIMTGNITPENEQHVDSQVKEAVNEVLGKTGLSSKANINYCSGVHGAFCHGKNQIFIGSEVGETSGSASVPRWVKMHDTDEIKFVTGHELGHLYNKDNLKMGLMALAAPVLTYASVKTFDLATSKLIDLIIKKMGLDETSRAYNILTKIKAINTKIITNPIVRFIIANQIFAAYSRYIEKRADLFAAKHGYTKGGISFMERLDKNMTDLNKSIDVLHPAPIERAKYLKEFK